MYFAKEFQCLKYQTANEPLSEEQLLDAQETIRISQLPYNAHKNRYRDVLPIGFDGESSTRVRLSPIRGLEGSDFINANVMRLGSKSYISCQAPMPHTIADFWRMIWEQQSTVIVMLTKLIENDRVKAHSYWPPAGQTHAYGFFSVTTLQECVELGIVLRHFQVIHLETGVGRFVTQLHSVDWPDNGAPRVCTSTCRLLQLHRALRAFHKTRQGLDGPAVVHCSAGIGRSGTFIAIDLMLDQVLQARRTLQSSDDSTPQSVFETVRWLRLRRKGMIQSLDQYKFIFRTLEEFRSNEALSDSDDDEEEIRTLASSPLVSCLC